MSVRKPTFVAAAILAIILWTLTGLLARAARGADAGGATPGGAAIFASTSPVTVKAIDPAQRLLTLATADGDTAVVRCGKNMVNFDKIQVGDQVNAFLIDRVAIFVGPDKGAANTSDINLSSYAPKDEKPSAVVADTAELSCKIISVDAKNHTVSIQGTEGGPQTINVSADVDLSKVKAGDQVRMVCTEGIALADCKAKDNAQPAALKLPAGQDIPGGIRQVTLTASALVTRIDPGNRLVTLQMTDGSTRTLHLGEEFINFDQIEPGDVVHATLAEQVAVSVNKPGASPKEGTSVAVARAPQGSKPGIVIARTEVVTGKIVSVNADNHTVTLTGPAGQSMTFKVGPSVNLTSVQKGDEVALQVTRGLSIVVQGR